MKHTCRSPHTALVTCRAAGMARPRVAQNKVDNIIRENGEMVVGDHGGKLQDAVV